MSAEIRKITVFVEETLSEMGQTISPPTRKAAAVAVIANPFAGRYVEDLTPLIEIGAELGGLLGRKCVEALGISPAQAESYGKAALVGEDGELEHAAALLHPSLGKPLRRPWKRERHWCPPRRSAAAPAGLSIFRSGTRMPLMYGRISTGWK